MPIEGSRARTASTYRGARRPEAIKLAKQRRRELLAKELANPKPYQPPKPWRRVSPRRADR